MYFKARHFCEECIFNLTISECKIKIQLQGFNKFKYKFLNIHFSSLRINGRQNAESKTKQNQRHKVETFL